jgi:hypothetical protein
VNTANPKTLESTSKDRKYWIEIYLAWSIVLTAVSILTFYVLIEYLQIGRSLSSLWLSPSGDSAYEFRNPVIGIHSFSDLILHRMYALSSSPYIAPSATNMWGASIDRTLPASNYPPFAHLFMLPISYLSYGASISLLFLATIGMITIPIFFTIRGISISSVVSVLVAGFVFTYPMLMILDRGNLQGLTTGFCIVALRLFLSKRYKLSAVMFGFAAGLKIYPILFMFLFVKRKRFNEFFLGCFSSMVITGLALLSFEGSIKENVNGFLYGLGTFTKVTSEGVYLLPNNHSPAALITYLSENSTAMIESLSSSILNYYSVIMFLVFTLATVIGSFTTRMQENQLLVLICVSIAVIPMIVYGYALTIFFLVLMHLFDTGSKLASYKRFYLQATIGLIALLFMAKGFVINAETSITLRTIVDPLILGALALICFLQVTVNKKHEFADETNLASKGLVA